VVGAGVREDTGIESLCTNGSESVFVREDSWMMEQSLARRCGAAGSADIISRKPSFRHGVPGKRASG